MLPPREDSQRCPPTCDDRVLIGQTVAIEIPHAEFSVGITKVGTETIGVWGVNIDGEGQHVTSIKLGDVDVDS